MHCVRIAYLIYWIQTSGGGAMSHSLYGYLSRQTTQVLEGILQSFSEDEDSELNSEIARLILLILEERNEIC